MLIYINDFVALTLKLPRYFILNDAFVFPVLIGYKSHIGGTKSNTEYYKDYKDFFHWDKKCFSIDQ